MSRNWFFMGEAIIERFTPVVASVHFFQTFQTESNCMPPKSDDAANAPKVASQPSMRRFLTAKPPVVPAFDEAKKRGRPPKKQKPGPKKPPDVDSANSLASTLPKSFTQPVLSSMFRQQNTVDSHGESDSSQPECEFIEIVLFLFRFMMFFVCSQRLTSW